MLNKTEFEKLVDNLQQTVEQPENCETLLNDIQKSIDEIRQAINELECLDEQAKQQSDSQIADTTGLLEKAVGKNGKIASRNLKKVIGAVVNLKELGDLFDTSNDQQDNSNVEMLSEDDLPLIDDFIVEAAEHIENAEAGLLELENSPQDNEAMNQVFRAFHTIKGLAGFLNLTQVNKLSHSAENVLDMARNNELKLNTGSMNIIFDSVDMLKGMIAVIKEAAASDKIVPAQPGLDALIAKLEDVCNGKEVAEKSEQDLVEEKSVPVKPSEITPEMLEEPVVKKKTKKNDDETVKLSTSRLDKLINTVGELVIAHSMVEQGILSNDDAGHELLKKVSHQGKIVRELQELSMLMRMVPVRGVFQKMNRLVRDLAQKSGKKINLVTEGDETELDRILVDQISDPLVHMIRNSVDHGIESQADRKSAGKSSAGTVNLKAYHKGGNIVIEISDDGKGLNTERILEKAKEKGLIDQSRELSENEIHKLIFHPGFSTAAKVTDISGRGVGMDVVKRNIEALRGRVDITSKLGEGSTFIITLPLTMAIIEGQIVRVGNEKYIIPIVSINSCIRPVKEQISSINNRCEMVNYQDNLMPLMRMYEVFNVEPDITKPEDSAVVILESDGKKFCLMVDELLGQKQVVIKNLGKTLGKINGVSGGAIMGDGKISLILDVAGLLKITNSLK